MRNFLQNIGEFILDRPLQFVGILILLYIGWKQFVFWFRFARANYMGKNLVYMKVLMPRSDTQKDREKDTEKDFREKVGIMSQFYRNIHEISELNIWNTFRSFIFNLDLVSFELVVQDKLVYFYVVTYKEFQGLIEKQITSYYSDADVQFVEPYEIAPQGNKVKGFYMYLSNKFWFPIKTFKVIENDPLNDMSNVLSKLEEGETAVIQIVINPKNDKWRKKAEEMGTAIFKGQDTKKGKSGGLLFRIPIFGYVFRLMGVLLMGTDKVSLDSSNAPGASGGDSYVRMLQTKEEGAKQIGEKAQQVGFDACIRILASSKTMLRAEEICNNIVLAFNLFKDPTLNFFQNRRIVPIDFINTSWLIHNFKKRLLWFGEKTSHLVPDELASLYHFPNSRYNTAPVIRWMDYRVLPAPHDTPQEGVLLGYNLFRGMKTEVHMLPKDRTRHHYCLGKSGSGKSVFLNFLARQDMKNGDGVGVIDPHGDLIEDLLQYVPKERAKDVVVFDPADQERPMGLNILEADTPEQMDLASSQATEIFIKLFGDEIFGPRIQHYFRNACLTLMEDQEEGATLIDVPRMFVDEDFMKYRVSKVNPIVKSFWAHEYAHTGARERQEMIPYFSSKFGPFITNSIMRNTIGQPKSAFNFRECMDNKKILLINLSKGKIGDLNTQLLGLVCVARLQMAAMSRVDIPQEQRKPFYLYVDEFQNFATDSFCSILSEARKYGLALIMAHQYINQLTVSKSGSTNTQIRDAVFGNVGTMMSFKVGAEDGEYLAKEYAPILTESDIIGISNYKAYIKLNINNTTSRPFSLETIYDTQGSSAKVAEIVKQYSRMKYGRKKVFVDQEITARIGIDVNEEIDVNQLKVE